MLVTPWEMASRPSRTDGECTAVRSGLGFGRAGGALGGRLGPLVGGFDSKESIGIKGFHHP